MRQRALSQCSRSVSDAWCEAAASLRDNTVKKKKPLKKTKTKRKSHTHTKSVLLSSSAESRHFQQGCRSVPRCFVCVRQCNMCLLACVLVSVFSPRQCNGSCTSRRFFPTVHSLNGQSVCLPSSHSINQPTSQSVIQLVSQPASQLAIQAPSQPVSQPVSNLVGGWWSATVSPTVIAAVILTHWNRIRASLCCTEARLALTRRVIQQPLV